MHTVYVKEYFMWFGWVKRCPPKVNNTNTEANSGFILFFSNDYFGIRIEL